MSVTGQLQEFALLCPKECGGKLATDIRFFLTRDLEVVIHGCCDLCEASGALVIPLSDLLMNSPNVAIN